MGPSDHDASAGWDEAEMATSPTGVVLIRGMEASCAANGIGVYPLTPLSDLSSEGFFTRIERTRESRAIQASRAAENLSADYPIAWEQVFAFAPGEGPARHPHIADAPIVAGTLDDRSAAFAKVLHPSSPYYVRYRAPDPIEAVQLVFEAGGAPVLAHPKVHARQRLLPKSIIEDMKEVGLFGIECDHYDYVPGDREVMDRITERLDLWVFSSSDYYDTGKPNRVGENFIAPAITDETIGCAHLEVLRP